LPGRSLRPFFDEGESLPPQPALIEYDEDWFEGPFCRARTIITEQYKLVVYASPGGGQLFDLENDPHETHNLWNDPAVAAVKAELMEQALRGFCRNDRLDHPRRSGA
jgi:arylsulfatase A-like enzyme